MTAQQIDTDAPTAGPESAGTATSRPGAAAQSTIALNKSRPFSEWVFGIDPEWIRLYRQLDSEGRLEEIEQLYVPRTIRLYGAYNRGPAIDELDLPPDGTTEEELDGLLLQNGWPSQRLQLKVYRGWAYLTSHSFPADPKATLAAETGEDADDSERTPSSFTEKLGAVIASEQGPAYVESMVQVIAPALINILAMYHKQAATAKLEAEAEFRQHQQQQLETAPHLAYQQRPVPQY